MRIDDVADVLVHRSSETSAIGVLSFPSPARSGAITVCPARRKREATLYQHHAPCQAP